jgi:hypothetical protein
MQQNNENDCSLELRVLTKEERILNLVTSITVEFLIGTIEQALLMAKFRL